VTRYYLSPTTRKADGGLLGTTRSVPSLSSFQASVGTVNLTIPTTIPLGAYYLIACADDTKQVPELVEADNCKASSGMVALAAAPDLVETYVSKPPASVIVEDSFVVTDRVKNKGNGDDTAPTTTRYYLSSTPDKTSRKLLDGARSVPVLAVGATSQGSAEVTIPGNIPSGTYYLLACADDLKAIDEGNEANNCVASSSMILLAAPDLIETGVTDPPSIATGGDSFSVSDVVKNQGDTPTDPTVSRYYLSRTTARDDGTVCLTGSRSVPALTPGALSWGTVDVTVPSTVVAGYSYYLLACADDAKEVTEGDETNNCTASSTTVLVLP
jgi:subtilase family serine protease